MTITVIAVEHERAFAGVLDRARLRTSFDATLDEVHAQLRTMK